MFLLFIGVACAAVSLGIAAILWFLLPGWKAVSGLSRVGQGKLASIDADGLRRALSLAFALVALAMLAVSVLLASRALPGTFAIAACLAVACVAFNAVAVIYRRFDRNVYPRAVRNASRALVISGNALIIAFIVFSLFLR